MGDNRVVTIWDEGYCTNAAPLISTTKQAGVVAKAKAEGLLDLRRDEDFDGAMTWLEIAQVHDPAYVRAMLTGQPRKLAESQGFVWSPTFSRSLGKIWSGHVEACRLALSEKLVLHPVSGAHHALFNRGSGFCTFNYLVGAGLALLRGGLLDRVGIIDLDAHQGDGTMDLTRDDERFSLFDIAHGSWIGRVTQPDRFYAVAKNAQQYFRHLRHLPTWLDANRPELVQYQAGMDCYQFDVVGGITGMNAAALEARDRYVIHEVCSRGIPLVVNLAGGYMDDGSTESLHVATIRVMQSELARQRAAA